MVTSNERALSLKHVVRCFRLAQREICLVVL